MTRDQFLNIKYKTLPYSCAKRGSSTKYTESVHVYNYNTSKNLNFHFDTQNNTVSVGLYDCNKIEREKLETLINGVKSFSEDMANEFIVKYLG